VSFRPTPDQSPGSASRNPGIWKTSGYRLSPVWRRRSEWLI